jgi:glycosyltransferase involved in cell wall biosynthesis
VAGRIHAGAEFRALCLMPAAAESPMLDAITPVLLTFNEGVNIGRTLANLHWAKTIIVVDSDSTDETLSILAADQRVRVFRRAFDGHPDQWRYAMHETGITTPWVLRLDADYQLSDSLVAEIASLKPGAEISAYTAAFDYAVFSRKLVSSLYPPKPLLLRRGRFSISDDGHTEAWVVEGQAGRLKSRVVHDDWKSMHQWVIAQARYMMREREKLDTRRSGLRDWLRMHPPLMPVAVFLYCFLWKRLLFSGRAGMLYVLQRVIAEAILSLYVLENRLAPVDSWSQNNKRAAEPDGGSTLATAGHKADLEILATEGESAIRSGRLPLDQRIRS